MRILLIVVYYPPSMTSAANMMRDLALELYRCGHQVTVVTPSDCIDNAICVSEEDSITVVRIKIGDLKSASKILRLWRESRLSASIWMKAEAWFRKNPSDLIVFYSPTIFFGELVSRLKALWGCPSYLIHRDIFPQWAVDAGVLRAGGILHRFLRHKELKQYAAADIVGVEAPGNLHYFDDGRQGSNFQTEVLYNWVGATKVQTDASKWRDKLGLDGKIVFVYGGNIGIAQDMDNIVRLASSLRDRDDIFFLLIGEGSETARLILHIERLGLTNIKILAAMPQAEYLECLAEFDVGVISLNRNFRSNNFTGKLLGYVACGKPVLASINPGNDLIDFLHRADAGIACANGDDSGLRSATLLLATEPQIRRRMGMNAHALASTTFSVTSVAEQIISHFGKRETQQAKASIQSARSTALGVQ